MKKHLIISTVLIFSLAITCSAQQKIYWGSDVPPNWNGAWPEKLLVPAEKSNFSRTATNQDILDYFVTLKWQSPHVHVFNAFTSDLNRNCPVIVLANPRITSARQARQSGKTVVYLQGGIHPAECEGKEALLMLMRDILLGEKKYLLDNLIILCCPNFNLDGNALLSVSNDTPDLTGSRRNAKGYDLNRDAIKLESTNMQGIMQNVFNTWDPTIILDTHQMESARHGYAIGYAACTVPTAHPGPRGYVTDKIFPALQNLARKNGQIEIHYHAGLDRNWPPRQFTHDGAAWTTEAKFQASGYGLRNRMSILVETPGHESYQKRIYSQYVFARELLEYCHQNGQEMQRICRLADEDTVNQIRTQAESGALKYFTAGSYESYGPFDIYAYQKSETITLPGTSIRRRSVGDAPPILCPNVELLTKPVGTTTATVPRGYLIPADLEFIVEKLRTHNVQVTPLTDPITVSGEEFTIDNMTIRNRGGYPMTNLTGSFKKSQNIHIPAGSYLIDMAQPLAHLIFYCLEPQVGDGFLGWGFLNDYLNKSKTKTYPIYKYFKILE